MNITIMTGNLGKDAELKVISEGKIVINMTLATTEKYKDKETTDWHNLRYWVKTDKIAQYLKKGTKISIVGKNKTDSYEKDGQKKYISYVLVNQLELLSKPEKQEVKETEVKQPDDDLPF